VHRSITLLFALTWIGSAGSPTIAEKEEFLKNAKIVTTRSPSKGITNTTRATMTNGTLTHDASIQTIDESKARFEGAMGTELNFKDSYKFNIAAYKLDRMLDLHMTPPSVARSYRGSSAAYTWWVDDVIMDEAQRLKDKKTSPNPDDWNLQMMILRVFDQLIYNTDRNLGNLVIDKDWKIWMIDHGRAFRILNTLREPKNLTKCDRDLLAKMKGLNEAALKKEMEGLMTGAEISGLLKRRDLIVKFFESRGESCLYSSPRRAD